MESLMICKICCDSENVSLFSSETLNTILEKIVSCFHIYLPFNKSLQLAICSKCVFELNNAYDFRNKCLTFKNELKKVCLAKAKMFDENKYSATQSIISENKEIHLSCGLEINNDGNKGKEIFQCSVCNKSLKTELSLSKHNLSMHMKRKHPGHVTGTGIDRRYHCTKCSYNTPHSQTLVNHLRTHNGERPYSCECGKTFTQLSSLSAHRKVHSIETFYTCVVCGKQFKHAFSLKKHQFVHDSGKFVCNICNKQLKSHQSLQDHIHRHNNVRNYSCEDCGNTFVTSSELHNHRKIHGELKSVECHVCGYKTHTKKNLIIHLKRHTGEKSFKCDICLLLFYTNGDLKKHQRVHTKNKPYACPKCSLRFTHSPSLNKHMLSVHGIMYKWADVKRKELQKKIEKRLSLINIEFTDK